LSEDEMLSEKDKIMNEIEDELKEEIQDNETIFEDDKKYLSKEFFKE
jgi:hypothetical protein